MNALAGCHTTGDTMSMADVRKSCNRQDMTIASVQQGPYYANIGARVEFCAPLPYDDVAGNRLGAAAEFDA